MSLSTASKENSRFSPDVISRSFIKQYYDLFARNPSELHRFYKEESTFILADVNQISEQVCGVEAIREKIQQLPLIGARVDLSEGSMDAHSSENNGVVLLVTGQVTLSNKQPRQFVQTFFLSPQSSSNQKSTMASFFVRNSMFRFLNSSQNDDGVNGGILSTETIPDYTSSHSTATIAIQTTASEPSEYSDDRNLAEKVSQLSQASVATATSSSQTSSNQPPPQAEPEAVEDHSEEQELAEEQVEAQEEVVDVIVEETEYNNGEGNVDTNEAYLETDYNFESTTTEIEYDSANYDPVQADTTPVPTSPPAPLPPSPPKSFADVVKRLADDRAAASRPAASAPVVGNTKSAKSSSSKRGYARGGEDGNGGQDTPTQSHVVPIQKPPSQCQSLYVNQIPDDVTEEELLQLFTKFGNVEAINLNTGKGYGFVDYSDSAGARLALSQADSELFLLKGKRLKIEERLTRPKNRASALSNNKGQSQANGGIASNGVSSGNKGDRRDGGEGRPRQNGGGVDGNGQNAGRSNGAGTGNTGGRKDGGRSRGGGRGANNNANNNNNNNNRNDQERDREPKTSSNNITGTTRQGPPTNAAAAAKK